MHWIDWVIVSLPLFLVVYIGLRSQRYVKGVADFLTGGRAAGRYLLCVAAEESGFGLVSLVAIWEVYYNSGFAFGFWNGIAAPIFVILGLTGYCTYRFRETRAMTLGQFLEIRYSRSFRLFAGILQSISGIINYGLFPAVGARFIVYFCGLPTEVEIFGGVFPTFALVMALFLSIAVLIATMGGQVTNMTTNCIQGILSYPMYVVVIIFILTHFSWFRDMSPAMLDRPPGKSLLNPFDIAELRDFNLFYVIVGILGGMINRMGWSGQSGYRGAARNAHEQKMAGVLSTWQQGFQGMMVVLLAVVAFTYLNSDKFQGGARGAEACRAELAKMALDDVGAETNLGAARREIADYLDTGKVTPGLQALLDKTAAITRQESAERQRMRYVSRDEAAGSARPQPAGEEAENPQAARDQRMKVAQDALRAIDPAASQTLGTIFGQMRVPTAMRYILPVGIAGLFFAICIFHLISTDTVSLHSWGSILVQDVILPLRKRPFTPPQQLRLLRILMSLVAVFAFFFSYFFGQVDYLVMFMVITGAIWLSGSGPCIVFGLYWKRGTAAGAWTALVSGATLAVLSIVIQKSWVGTIYPWLYEKHLVDAVAIWLERASAPFEPIIKWRMSSEKFPINSQELYFLNMLLSVSLYVIVSLLTCRQPFNMERMLHRGRYHREGEKLQVQRITLRNVIPHLVGIDNQYTRGDRILAWSVFIWSFGWQCALAFIGVAVWNFISPWSNRGWSLWFFINNFLIAGAIGVVSTVWFMIGGTRDLRRLYKALDARQSDLLDDGRVIGHVSADEVALVETTERPPAEQTPVEAAVPGKQRT